ncbi:PREDICTED: transcription elongation factor B polypeptide 2 [Condylura cristata]|uniref:transcription elongation factor B polypeptide 2 n=1 Tax=Condylura cristata TaxID=143302 RepID=UPI0003344B03|nr:PREDICTED: transcription elongation factor B polypeptide 2 [Condylura cristata]
MSAAAGTWRRPLPWPGRALALEIRVPLWGQPSGAGPEAPGGKLAAPEQPLLPQDDQLLDDGKTLGECGFTSQTARPQAPATVGLAFRADEAFEALRIEPFSSPPELPDVMKPQDSGSSANEQAVQ